MKYVIALGSIVIASVCTAPQARADAAGSGLTFSLMGGSTVLDKHIAMEDDFLGGGRIGYILHPRVHVEGLFDSWRAPAGGRVGGATMRADHYGLDLVLNLFPGRLIDPYLAGGYARIDWRLPWDNQIFNGYEAGGGVRLMLAEGSGWRWDFRMDARQVFGEAPDGLVALDQRGETQGSTFYSAGVQLSFGGAVDSDGDGVPDKKDQCADTPRGAHVDVNGCPTDADGDGVYDGIDQCPGTPRGATVDAKGCPSDSDGDGVYDGIDRCNRTPKGAPVDRYGCAKDSDGDGVHDGIDRCPGTVRGAPVDRYGCAKDSDGDGVHDGIDQCPNTPRGVRVDARGCEVSKMEQEMLDTGMIRLDMIHFQSGKAALKPDSYPSLDEVGKILSKWGDLRIEVGGHTDSQGSAKFNEKLSGERASAVRDYLLANFPKIKPSQLTAKGYGESQPIADNGTKAGRAKNRRVEFKVLNRGVLTK